MESVKCGLCGKDQPRPYLSQADRFSGQIFSLVQCSNCGLIYLNPRPTQNELAEYYPSHYESFYDLAETESAFNQIDIQNALRNQLDYVEKYASNQNRLLDVGCAKGNFLRVAKRRGWDVTGIEINIHAAEIAREKYGLNVITGTLETAQLSPNSFDAITFWDVLEHVPNPIIALQRVFQLLKPDGIVVFSIPNVTSFDRHLFKSRWIGWDAPRHFTLFTDKTIRVALSECKLNFVDRQCITGGKGTFLLSMDIVLHGKKQKEVIQRFYPLLGWFLWPYRKVSYLLNRGPIVTYIARKPDDDEFS